MINDELFERLKEFTRRFIMLKKQVASSVGISLSECNILCVVFGCEPIMQTKLSEVCGIDKPATSRLINKMLECGLIIKFNENNNKKNSFIGLSEKGKELVLKINQKTEEKKLKFFKSLSDKDKVVVLKILNKILK